jgi:hypothetical protein
MLRYHVTGIDQDPQPLLENQVGSNEEMWQNPAEKASKAYRSQANEKLLHLWEKK